MTDHHCSIVYIVKLSFFLLSVVLAVGPFRRLVVLQHPVRVPEVVQARQKEVPISVLDVVRSEG